MSIAYEICLSTGHVWAKFRGYWRCKRCGETQGRRYY